MNLNNYALTTLSQNPEYFDEVIRLIEEGFRYSEANHYELDFAPLVHPLNFENCFLFIDKETNNVAAHLAVCIRTLVKDNIETKIALIGGIVTSSKHRNKNLFKNLMDNALETFKDQVALFLLWSDLEGLYERFFFYRTGGIIETGKKNLSSSERPRGYEKTKFSQLSDRDLQNVIQLYQSFNEKKFFTIKREEKDWSIIKEMSSIDLYVNRNDLGEIKKYFCVNKGKDLNNIIHEVSCLNIAEYRQMIKELGSYKIWLPETEQDILGNAEIFYTVYMRLGDLKMLNEFLGQVSQNQLEVLKISNEQVAFNFQDKTYNTSSKEFLQYLFGPKPLDEFIDYQLSLYIAGADSI